MKEIAGFPASRRMTIESCERYADLYNALVAQSPNRQERAALQQVALIAGLGGRVLQMGSGHGQDADFLESLGVRVERTNVARGVSDLRTAQEKVGELHDLIADALQGPYDAVVAHDELVHVPPDRIDGVLARVAKALRPRGAFLVSMCEGGGDKVRNHYPVYWRRDEFAARLKAAGLTLLWDEHKADSCNARWNLFLTRRAA